MSDNYYHNPYNGYNPQNFDEKTSNNQPQPPQVDVYKSSGNYVDPTELENNTVNIDSQSNSDELFGSFYNNSNTADSSVSQSNNTDVGVRSSAQWGADALSDYQTDSSYGSQPNAPYYTANVQNTANVQSPTRVKKKPKNVTKGFVVAMLVVSILVSSVLGFAGGFMANKVKMLGSDSDSDSLIINKVEIDEETMQSSADKSTSQIASEVADSVVEIVTEVMTTNSFYGQYVSQGAGSGVIISKDGYIITNNHVIEDASSIKVTLRDGTNYEATLVGTDSMLDVALLKIDADGLKAATYGDSGNLKVGDKAVAIGNPLGQLGGTVTDGIISALNRDVVIDSKTMNLLQTDTAINPGNSGGGLFDGQGVLIGIVVAKSTGEEIEGLGFAIPINDVIDVVDDLKNYGYVKGRISTGMELINLTNSLYSMYYYRSTEPGCYVSSVESNSNAQQAGICVGDRIEYVNGTEVSSKSDVEDALKSAKVGDSVVYQISRQGKTQKITVELEEYVPTPQSDTIENSNNNNYYDNPFGF